MIWEYRLKERKGGERDERERVYIKALAATIVKLEE